MKERWFLGLACAVGVTVASGCFRLQTLRVWPRMVEPIAAMPAPMGPAIIPRQGYLERGYLESTMPYSPGWGPHGSVYPAPGWGPFASAPGPNLGQAPHPGQALPAHYVAPAGPQFGQETGVHTAAGMPSSTPPAGPPSLSPEAELALKQSLEELHGKYNLVLDEISELR